MKPEDYADMRIEVVKRELNQGALAGLRSVTDYAARLVVAALDTFDDEARKAEFRRGFTLGQANERLLFREAYPDLPLPWLADDQAGMMDP